MSKEILNNYPSSVGRASLARRLGVPYSDVMQDWEWEVAEPERFFEYFTLYSHSDLTDDERLSLVEIMIQSIADMDDMSVETLEDSLPWISIKGILVSDPARYSRIIRYWAQFPDGGIANAMEKLLKELGEEMKQFEK